MNHVGVSAIDEAFWSKLELLFRWKRKHMPVLDMPQGAEVLIWLLKNATHVRPLKDLYRRSRFSEPTIRWVLKALVDDGFIVIDRNPDDLRVRTVHLTPKLVSTVRQYLDLLRECVPAASDGRAPGDAPPDLPYPGSITPVARLPEHIPLTMPPLHPNACDV